MLVSPGLPPPVSQGSVCCMSGKGRLVLEAIRLENLVSLHQVKLPAGKTLRYLIALQEKKMCS